VAGEGAWDSGWGTEAVEQPSREAVFLALVGQQPAATAVLLKSWVGESGPPDEIWLLATSHVERTGVAARLRAFCASVVPGTRCEVVPIASGLEDAAGRPSARTWVRDFLASREQRAQVIFAGDPGPSFIVAAAARLLPRDATSQCTPTPMASGPSVAGAIGRVSGRSRPLTWAATYCQPFTL